MAQKVVTLQPFIKLFVSLATSTAVIQKLQANSYENNMLNVARRDV